MSKMTARKGWRRAVAVAAVVGVLALVMAILVWFSLPRWHTQLIPIDPKTGVVIAIDYPDGWKPDDQGDFGRGGKDRRITFKQQQPTGLALWWRNMVMGQKSDPASQPRIGLTLFQDFPQKINEMESQMKKLGPNFSLKVGRSAQALGPALNIEAQIPMRSAPGVPANRGKSQNSIRVHEVMMFPDISRLPKGMCLVLSCTSAPGLFPVTDAQFSEMVRRLRLVQTAVGRSQ